MTRFALALALVVNLLLMLALSKAGGGQVAIVELRNDGGAFAAFTDGHRVVPGEVDQRSAAAVNAPDRGTIVLVLPVPLDALPSPSGIDSIVVSGPDGEELLRDDFDVFDIERWEVLAGDFRTINGVLEAQSRTSENSMILRDAGWAEYDVKVTYRNGRSGVIGVNVTGDGSLFYHFDLLRDFPNYFRVTRDGEQQPGASGSLMRTNLDGPLRSTGWMLARSYPYVLGALAAGSALTLIASFLPVNRIRLRATEKGLDFLSIGAVMALAAGAFGITLYLNATYYSFLPHVPDEVSYLFQARLLADLRVTGDIPTVGEAFQFYAPAFLYEHNGQWASFYPFGHPLFLALGQAAGAVNLMPSLGGAACVILTFVCGRRFFDTTTGLAAAVLLAASPFFLMQASSFMSHSTAALYFLLAFYFILRRDTPLVTGALGGLFFGLAINTRLLTAVALTPVFGMLMLSFLLHELRSQPETDGAWRQSAAWRPWLSHTGMFVFAVLLMAGALLAYNAAITGDPLTTPYSGPGGESELYGFRDGHSLDIGLRNVQAQLAALVYVFNGWPAPIALSLLLLPFVLGTHNWRDHLLAAAVIFPVALYVGYRFSGIYEGPRYWYETMPFLVLLSARGVALAAERIVALVAWARKASPVREGDLRFIAHAGLLGLVAVLSVYGTAQWLTGDERRAQMALVPENASAIEGLFGVDDRLNELADEMDLYNALVLVKPCGFFESRVCYGSVFLRNNLDFDGPVVWARFDQNLNAQTIAAYPGRTVYIATWDPEARIEPLQ